MSELTPPAAESAAPAVESTESIVESAMADLRSDEASASSESAPVSGTTTTTTTAPTATTVESMLPPTATQAEKDELAEALGIVDDGTPSKWTNRVQYSKINKAYKALREKHEAAHAAALKTHQDENSNYKAQVAQFDSLVNNPEQLLSALAAVNPAYKRFLTAQPTAPAAGVPERIETLEDLQRVIDARVADVTAPILNERKAQAALASAQTQLSAELADASAKWPGFKDAYENPTTKAEMNAVLKANPTWGLRDVYINYVVPKLAAGRDQMRQSVIEELKTRPHSSTVTTTVSGRGTQSAEPVNTEDIVREQMRKLKD